MDRHVLIVTYVLALIGLVMVFSASGVMAESRYQASTYFLGKQATWLAVGLLALHTASYLNYEVWRNLTILIVGFIMLLLILVLLPSLGAEVKGARRWLRIGMVSVQPAEMAKLAVVFYLATYLSRKGDRITEFSYFFPPVLIVGLMAALILAQPDMGTAVLLCFLLVGLLFIGGARILHLFGLVLVLAPLAMGLIMGSEYRQRRLFSFLDPWQDPTDSGFQLIQSFLALGNGGLLGVGLAEGKQKLFFLPEAHTDFVLAFVGEELGLLGTGSLMVLFALLVLKGFQIAQRAEEPFGRYLALGVTLLLGVQALINAGVVCGLLPTKGLTLPLVSYGGSSLLTSLLAIGILLSISRDRQKGYQLERLGR